MLAPSADRRGEPRDTAGGSTVQTLASELLRPSVRRIGTPKSAAQRAQTHFGKLGPRDILRLDPFHTGCPNKRQPALHSDLGGIAHPPHRDELIDQALTHNAELLGDDRLDGRVIRQCTTVNRDRLEGMIDKRLNVSLESSGKLFSQRQQRIRAHARQETVTSALQYCNI